MPLYIPISLLVLGVYNNRVERATTERVITMKFLIVASAVLAVALAQGQQRPRQQQQQNYQQQQNNYQQQQQQPQQNNNYQQDSQQDDYNNKAPQQQAPQTRQSFQPEQRQDNIRSTTYIPIIRFDKEQGADGSYKAAWETGNNIIAEEQGYVKDIGPDPDQEGQQLKAQVQQGSYSYTSPEGQLISVSYTADEFGFHPTGDHLPTPPPVSAEVQKGLDLIYAGIKKQQELAARQAQEPQRQNNPQQNQFNNQPQRNQYRE